MRRFTVAAAALALAVSAWPASAQSQPPPTPPPPKPSPFPGSTPPATGTAPAKPQATAAQQAAAAPQDGGAIDPRLAGLSIYPGAELLSSFDAGRGQFVFLFGTNMPYSDIVAYYKSQLRTSGSEVFRAPATHQFDLGPFRSETMAFRPSVVVKDYTWMDSPGYLHVSGTTETRYRTVIQIVPVGR